MANGALLVIHLGELFSREDKQSITVFKYIRQINNGLVETSRTCSLKLIIGMIIKKLHFSPTNLRAAEWHSTYTDESNFFPLQSMAK